MRKDKKDWKVIHMSIRKFLKDFKFFKRVKISKDFWWAITDYIGMFLIGTYKLSMAFVPGIVAFIFLNHFFGVIVIIAGFYKFILDLANCGSIKELCSQIRWVTKNK